MRHRICLLIALVLPLSAFTQETEPSIHTTVNEVMLDVVVRDKKAHIIRDLRPQEVQIFEDGVPQKVRHFEFFDGHASPPPSVGTAPAPEVSGAAPAPGAPNPPRNVQELRDISVVSVVVSNLDQQGRKLTLDTMRDFVKNQMGPNTYVGVFWLDLYRIRPVQLYTNDVAKISSAMMRVVQGVGVQGQRNLNGLRPDSVVRQLTAGPHSEQYVYGFISE